MNDAPECWGQFDDGLERCRACPYRDACRLYRDTEPAMDRPLGHSDFDAASGWALDLADVDHIPGDEPDDEPSPRLECDFGEFLMFLLHLDDYTLGVIAEIIAPRQNPEKRYSVADLARAHGISRQGMHRKTLDIARKSPELSSLLRLTLKKIRSARQTFATPPRRRRSGAVQMELGL